MKHFSQFEILNNKLHAKLHEEGETHSFAYSDQIENCTQTLKLGTLFVDETPSKLMKKITSVRKYHAENKGSANSISQ